MDRKVIVQLFLAQFVKPFFWQLLDEYFITKGFLQTQNKEDSSKGSSLLTTAEVSAILKFNRHKIYTFISDGELIAIEIGGEYRFKREDVDKFINNRATGRK